MPNLPNQLNLTNSPIKILIAGEGGQGVQAIGEILTEAALLENLKTFYLPNFGVEQRGGISLAYVQIFKSPIPYPKFKIANILVILSSRAIQRIREYFDHKTEILNGIGFQTKPGEHGLSARTYNILILGILSSFLPFLKKENILKSMEERFFGKPKEILEQNKQAFLLGQGLAKNLPEWAKKLKPPEKVKEFKEIIKKDKSKKAIIHPKLCKSCGLCIEKCPTGALCFSKDVIGYYGNKIIDIDLKKCIACGTCEKTCPDCAIEIKK